MKQSSNKLGASMPVSCLTAGEAFVGTLNSTLLASRVRNALFNLKPKFRGGDWRGMWAFCREGPDRKEIGPRPCLALRKWLRLLDRLGCEQSHTPRDWIH